MELRRQLEESAGPKCKKRNLRVPADDIDLVREALKRIKQERAARFEQELEETAKANHETVLKEIDEEEKEVPPQFEHPGQPNTNPFAGIGPSPFAPFSGGQAHQVMGMQH